MSSVDTRVVQMQFDNKQFESGVKETMKTLDRFKESLNFVGLEKGFSVIENACQAVTDKFSMFGVITDQILRNIGNKVYSMGHQLLGTINQMGAGMSKYESLMNATRTMMNATGKSVGEIEQAMFDLNKYTDETSYNFSDLVSAMSSIMSSGAIKDLGLAEKTMEGIANASAHAGIGIHQASGVINVITKAMSEGKMSRIRWESLQLQNFITPQFIDEAIKAGQALGTLDKNAKIVSGKGKGKVVNSQTIMDTLQYGWMDAKVMSEVFGVYADNTKGLGEAAFNAAKEARTFTDVIDSLKDAISTGWMKSFEYLFGNVEQAAKFFTWMANAVIDVSASISEFRNELLKGWSEGGGRNALVDTVVYIWETLVEIGGQIATAFTNIFGVLESQDLLDFTTKIQEAVQNVYYWLGGNANESGDKIAPRMVLIRQAFEGLFSVLSFGWDIAKGFFGFVGNVIEVLFGSADSFLMSVGAWGRNLKSFFDGIRENKDVPNFFTSLFETVKPFVESVRDFATAVFNFIGSLAGLKTAEEEGATVGSKFLDAFNWLKDGAKSVLGFLTNIFTTLTKWFNFLGQAKDTKELAARFKFLWAMITLNFKLGWASFRAKAAEWLETLKVQFSWWLIKFKLFTWPKIKRWFSETVGKIGDWIAETWPKIKKWFSETAKNVGDWLAETWPKVKTAVSEWFTSFVDSLPETWQKVKNKVEKFFGNVGDWFREHFGSLFSKKDGQTPVESAVEAGKTVVEALASVDKKDAEKAEGAVGFFDFVRDIIASIGDILTSIFNIIKGVVSIVDQIVTFAASNPLVTAAVIIVTFLTILATAISSGIKQVQLIKNGLPKKQSFFDKFKEFAISIGIIAAAIGVLAVISSYTSIWGAVGAISAMFVLIIGVSIGIQAMEKKFPDLKIEEISNKIRSIGFGLLGMSISIGIMAMVIKYFAGMDSDTFWKGSWKLGIVLLAISFLYSVIRIAISKFGRQGDFGTDKWKGILALAVGLGLLVGAFSQVFRILQKTEGEDKYNDLIAAVAAISVLAVALGASVRIMGQSITKGVFGAFVGMTIAIYTLGILVETCNRVDWHSAVIAFGGIGIILFLLTRVIDASKDISNTSVYGILVLMLGFAAVVVAVSVALNIAKDVPLDIAITFFAGLIGMVLSLALVLKIVSKNEIKVNSLIAVGGIMLAVGLLALATAGILHLIPRDLDLMAIIGFCISMIVVVGAVALLSILVAHVAKIVDGISILGILKAIAVVAMVGVLALALGLLAVLFGEIAFDAIKNMLTNLSESMFILGTGFKYWKGLTADVDLKQIAVSLFNFIVIFIQAVALLLTVNYDAINSFRVNLFTLGVAIKGFNERITGVDRVALQEKMKVIDDIVEAANKLNDVPNIGNMSETITNIGGAIKLYYESLNGVDMAPKDSEGNPIDTSQFDTQGFVQMFKSIAGQMPDEEDLEKVGLYVNNGTGTSLGNFAVGITNLSTALTTFSNEMKKADQAAIQQGITNLQSFSGIQQALPTEESFNSFFGFFSKKKETLGEFGADIEAVGAALASFATSFSGALSTVGQDAEGNDITNMDMAIAAAERMQKLGEALPTRNSAWLSWFAGSKMSLGEFGANMSILGEGINKFITKVFADGATYNGTEMDGIIDVVDAFVEIQNKIVKKESRNALDTFATYLGQAGEGIRKFNKTAMFDKSGNAVNYDSDKLKTLAEIVDIFVEIQNKIEKKDWGNTISDFAGWLVASSGNFKSFFESASSWTIDTDKLKAMGEMAGGIAEAFGKGFGDKASEAIEDYSSTKITGSITKIVGDISAMFDPEKGGQFYSDMVDCGHYMVLGLEKGINDYAYRVTNAGRNLGSGASGAVKSVVMVNSPSKVMEEIGKWIDIGMERGIIDYSGKPIEAAEFMAYGIEEAIRDATTVHSNPPLFNNIGGWIVKGMANGFDGEFPNLFDLVNGRMTELKDAFSNGWDNILAVFNGKKTLGEAVLSTLNLDEKKMAAVMDAFTSGDYATLISELTGVGLGESQIMDMFGLNSENFIEGTSLEDMLKNVFGLGHDTTVIEADNVDVGKVDTLGGSTGSTSLGGKSTSGRGSSESSNLGKQTTTVSSGGLNLSMTDGYTIGDILNRIDRLETAITNMRIVMDSGVLAGQVASGVDKELGNYATLNGRWN